MSERQHRIRLDEVSEGLPLHEILWHCFRQNYHADHSNAAIHCAAVRYSPITFRLAEYLWNQFPGYRVNELLVDVISDLKQYEEDPGR